MLVKQISVFVENKSGRLAEITKILGENQINIQALSIADTTDFGILRLIVNKPDEAEAVLREKGFTVKGTQVIAISIEDKPGGLSVALNILNEAGIGIEYMYAFTGKCRSDALVILRVEDHDTAISTLTKNGVTVMTKEVVYSL